MTESVLVAYATRYGSTLEVAEAVAAGLRDHGLKAELQPVRKVKTLEAYDAFVLGAPYFIGKMHKDARRFLEQHQGVLAVKPVAIFALGPTKPEEMKQPDVMAQLDRELAKLPWLKPVATVMFGGKYDPAALRFPDSLLATLPASPLHNAPASDARDWQAIRAWARELAGRLKP